MPGPQDGDLRTLEGVDWTPVSEKLIPARLVGEAIGAVVFLAIVSVPLVLVLTGVWPAYPAWLAWGLPAVVLAWSLVDILLVPRRVRAIGYAEREDDFLVKSGLFFRRVLAVPYGRLQYLDVKEGPVQRHFGIRTLELQTASASTNATLPGIPVEDSERLRDQLMARGQARLAGL
ncbi:MAG: PH domain-containing protein [Micrococcus sp.]|nr:PH domain-containing protein [Micrococcus sp.]